jgi:hypothetical protein
MSRPRPAYRMVLEQRLVELVDYYNLRLSILQWSVLPSGPMDRSADPSRSA